MTLGPWISEDDNAAVRAVLDRGDLMSGRLVEELEHKLAEYFGKRWCVCVSSGTAALECAFVATGEGTLIHPHGFVAILSAARAAGRHPMESSDRLATYTDVLGVGFTGVGRVHDCAHRFDKGAAHAEVSCFSFAPNKFIAAVGGCLLTNDAVVAATARQYRNHGRDGGPEIFREGRNLRMAEVSAALALSQLKRIDEILARRQQVAKWYCEILAPERVIENSRESWFLFPHHKPGHKQRSLADFRLFNTATQEDRDTALLPIFPLMTKDDVATICASLIEEHK